MSAAVERYRQRATAQRRVAGGAQLVLLPDVATVRRLAEEAPSSESAIDGDSPGHCAPPSGNGSVQATLDEAGAAWDRQRWNLMLEGMLSGVLRSLAGPFGLGHLLAASDQHGGKVDTTHNVRKGIYATEEERRRYEDRAPSPSSDVYEHVTYREAGAALKRRVLDGTATDAYTGAYIKRADLHDRQRGPSTDHAVPHTKVAACRARVLAEQQTADVANDPTNLVSTTRSVNSSLRDRTAEESGERLREGAPVRQARLAKLEACRGQWTDQERKQYNRLKAIDSIDPDKLKEAETRAQAAIDRRIDLSYYTSGKFWSAAVHAGASQGVALGAQQALGVVLVEFFAGAIDEARSLYREGVTLKTLFAQLGVRLRRVAARIGSRRDELLAAFGRGFVAGLLSSLITTLVNAFATTARRVARMLREGALSLLQAARLLIMRPDAMTPEQALHEASKVLVGAGVLAGGIALEEVVAVQLALVPGIALFATTASDGLVGALTAVLASLAVYLVDQMDVFKANAEARSVAVNSAMQERLETSVSNVHTALARLRQVADAL